MITIEFADKREVGKCPCCGGNGIKLTRFVYKDNNAYAIYYALYSDNHPEKDVIVTISIGKWEDNIPSETRTAFNILFHPTEEKIEMRLIDQKDSPWGKSKILGKMVDRDDALKHPLITDVFQIADLIANEDKELLLYIYS